MSSLNSDIDHITGLFKQVIEQVTKDRQQVEEDRRANDQEKQKWEEEKIKINNTFIFHGQVIDLNVGGTHYSTSRSTLTKYPESMLGVMFSGRHDLETMKCSDGSFFIDRDGGRFRYILEYLRDGEEVTRSFPKSADILLGLFRDAEYYQLDGLFNVLKPLVREVDIVSQTEIAPNFKPGSGNYKVDTVPPKEVDYTYVGPLEFNVSFHSVQAVSYKHKNLSGLSFDGTRFNHPLSFLNCNLTDASFMSCSFGSNVTFEHCILDNTAFSRVEGLVTNVSFTDSNTDGTSFGEFGLREALHNAGKISLLF